jgi:AbrB family looped-hinge helix DNA binding protein
MRHHGFMTTRMAAKGRVTIPKTIRDRLGLKAGDEIDFVIDRDDVKIRKRVATSAFGRFHGHLSHLTGKDPDQLVAELRGE